MPYRVTIAPGHPTGIFRRDGRAFSRTPTILPEVSEAIRQERWLIVEEISVPEALAIYRQQLSDASGRLVAERVVEDLDTMTYADLVAAAKALGLSGQGTKKVDLIERIKGILIPE